MDTGTTVTYHHNEYADFPPQLHCSLITDDPRDVIEFALKERGSGAPSALALLTGIHGGAYRALGAMMAITGDGEYCGYLTGGCVEAAVAAEGLRAIRDGCDQTVTLGRGSRFFDIVLPCGGGIEVAIHVARDKKVLRKAVEQLEMRRSLSLGYHGDRQELTSIDGEYTGWRNGVFFTCLRPKIRLVLAGAGPELVTTARVAEASGLEVIIANSLTELQRTDIDQHTAVVTLYHDLHKELPFLKLALRAEPFFVGALGSSRTHRRRLTELRQAGFSGSTTQKIKSPVGIVPKARSAQALALSVVADVVAAKAPTEAVSEPEEASWRNFSESYPELHQPGP